MFPTNSVASAVGDLLQIRMTGESAIYDSDSLCEDVHFEHPNTIAMENNDEKIITITNFDDVFDDSEMIEEPTTG